MYNNTQKIENIDELTQLATQAIKLAEAYCSEKNAKPYDIERIKEIKRLSDQQVNGQAEGDVFVNNDGSRRFEGFLVTMGSGGMGGRPFFRNYCSIQAGSEPAYLEDGNLNPKAKMSIGAFRDMHSFGEWNSRENYNLGLSNGEITINGLAITGASLKTGEFTSRNGNKSSLINSVVERLNGAMTRVCRETIELSPAEAKKMAIRERLAQPKGYTGETNIGKMERLAREKIAGTREMGNND